MFRRFSSYKKRDYIRYVSWNTITYLCTYLVVPVNQDQDQHPCCKSSDLHMLCDACCSSTRVRAAYNIDN
jgi:hypothetical protein